MLQLLRGHEETPRDTVFRARACPPCGDRWSPSPWSWRRASQYWSLRFRPRVRFGPPVTASTPMRASRRSSSRSSARPGD